MLKRQRHGTRGQSIVEFALSSIVLFLLLAAAVDIGRIFLTYQTMINAVKEGLSYGAYRPLLPNTADPSQPLTNDTNIRYRIRNSNNDRTTNKSSVSFINLLDLNNNGVDDSTETNLLDTYLAINTRVNDSNANCLNRDRNCWMRITMLYDYRPIFPLTPIFGKGIQLRVVREQQIIRSTNAEIMPTPAPAVAYEGESGAMSGAASSASGSCSGCSGGLKVRNIGNGSANFVTINNVSVSSAGTYTVQIDYLVSGTRSFWVSVNGGSAIEVICTGSSWSTPASTSISVPLNAGNNSIKFFNNSAYAPDLDRIIVQ
jgi:hypothetical protein